MAIGSTLDDLPMMQAADLSVGVSNPSSHPSMITCDITIPTFSKLKYIILCLGHWTFTNIIKVMCLSVY